MDRVSFRHSFVAMISGSACLRAAWLCWLLDVIPIYGSSTSNDEVCGHGE